MRTVRMKEREDSGERSKESPYREMELSLEALRGMFWIGTTMSAPYDKGVRRG
jgi:hypothetical protein